MVDQEGNNNVQFPDMRNDIEDDGEFQCEEITVNISLFNN